MTPLANISGYYTVLRSGPNVISDDLSNTITVTSDNGRLFTLYCAIAAAVCNDNLILTITGYKSNEVILNNDYTLQVFAASYLTFSEYCELDTLVFSASAGTPDEAVGDMGPYFAMDSIYLSFI